MSTWKKLYKDNLRVFYRIYRADGGIFAGVIFPVLLLAGPVFGGRKCIKAKL